MRTKLIRIGNSRAVRLPGELLEAAGLHDELDLSVEGPAIILRSADHPRAGWEAAFREMAERGDDELLDPDVPTEFDENEWEWP
jgi:antitoxin MazE